MSQPQIDFYEVKGETLTMDQLRQGLTFFQKPLPQAKRKAELVQLFTQAQSEAKTISQSPPQAASQVIDIDYETVDPETLSILQLKQGITYFGSKPAGGKQQLLASFKRLQNNSNNNLQSLQADEDRTQQVDIDTAPAINAFLPAPEKQINNHIANDDLTQTAFQITGAFPTSNEPFRDKLRADRQKYSDKVSSPKTLKANFEFERTPQSVQLDSFVKAPGGGNLAQTQDFNVGATDSGEMGTALNYTAQQLTALRENAAGIRDDADVARLNSTVQKTIQSQKKSVTFNKQSMAAELNQHSGSIQNTQGGKYQPKSILKDPKSKLGIDDLVVEHKNQQTQQKSLHFMDRDSITKISIQGPNSQQQQLLKKQHQQEKRKQIRKERTINILTWLCIMLVMMLLCFHVINIVSQRRVVYIPILSSIVNRFFIFLLPNKMINESTSFSLYKPKHCPAFTQCDRHNQIEKCFPGYKRTYLNKLQYVSDFKFKVNNYLAFVRDIHLHIKEDIQQHVKQKEYYSTDICAKDIKDIAKYRKTLRQIESNILKIYGDEYCKKPNLKLLKKRKMNETQILNKIREEKPICLNQLFAFQRLSDFTKKHFLELLDSNKLSFIKQETLQFTKIDNINISEALQAEKVMFNEQTYTQNDEIKQQNMTEYDNIMNQSTIEQEYSVNITDQVTQVPIQIINETEAEKQETEYTQLIDKCLFSVVSYSSPKKNAQCQVRMLVMMHKLRIIYQFLRLCILLAFIGFAYFQIKCAMTASKIYKEIKLQLIKIKHRELSNDASSSCAQYALKAESLKYQYLNDYIFKEKIWKQVEKKLQNDIQVDKQWARTRNGAVTEAYYYNGDALIKIKRKVNDTEYVNANLDELSEHSLSY